MSVYSILCTIIIIFLSTFLARCGGKRPETQIVDGDSQSATKTDIGLLIYDAGNTNGGEGETCVCPQWTSITILEICVMRTLILLGIAGIYKLVRNMLVYLATKKAKAGEEIDFAL